MSEHKQLQLRSVNRVVREIKVFMIQDNEGKYFNNLYGIENIFSGIIRDAEKIREKISAIAISGGKTVSKNIIATIKCSQRDIDYRKGDISDYVKGLINFTEYQYPEDNLRKALTYLIETYRMVSFESPKLIVQTDDIFVQVRKKTVSFGAFNIVINFEELGGDNILYGFICKALTPRRKNGHTHPNLSTSDRLCTGAGGDVLKKCFNECRLGDFIDVIQQILNTHSTSPYLNIDYWY